MNEVTAPVVTSNTVDVLVNNGIALDCIGKALLNHPELEMRYCNGAVTLWREGVQVWRGGTSYLEPTSYDWREFAIEMTRQ